MELVSTKFGVNSSEPIAMISADSMRCSGKRLAHDPQVDLVERSRIHDHHRFFVVEGKPDEIQSGDDKFRRGALEAKDPAFAAMRCHDVQLAFDIECDSLRPAEPGIELFYLAAWRDAVHGVEARCGRSRNVEIIVEAESHVISGDAGLQRREHEDFLAGADLE